MQANLAMKVNAKVGGVNTCWSVLGHELLRSYFSKEVRCAVLRCIWPRCMMSCCIYVLCPAHAVRIGPEAMVHVLPKCKPSWLKFNRGLCSPT